MERITGTPPNNSSVLEYVTLTDGTSWTQDRGFPVRAESAWIVRGTDTPNFNRSKERLPLNSYYWHRYDTATSFSWGYSFRDSSDNGWNASCSSDFMAVTPAFEGTFATDQEIELWFEAAGANLDALTTGAAAKLAKKYFDLGTALGELRETVRMFKSFLTQFLKIVTSMRPAHLIELINSPNALASRWLWYRYGLMPFVYSIRDFIKANNAKSSKLKWYSEREKGTWNYNKEDTFEWDHGPFSLSCIYDIDVKISAYGYAGSQVRPSLYRIAPLTTGWELIRFSFIVDWFINVGSFLTSLEAAVEFPDLALSRNYKVQYTKSFRGSGMNNCDPGWSGTFNTSSVTTGEVRVRAPGGALGELQFNGFGLSDIHLADLLALLISALSKKSS